MRTLADLAMHLNFRGTAPPGGNRLPPIILLTDDLRLADPFPAVARLPAGSLVILRHYQAKNRADLALRLSRLCRARRLRLVIAADFRLAVALGCGLHLPEGMAVGSILARQRLWHRKRGLPLTVAAHGRRGLGAAGRAGADAALLSPVFPTPSHPGAASLGLLTFRSLAQASKCAVFGLGGLTPATAPFLVGSGAVGIAAIGGYA